MKGKIEYDFSPPTLLHKPIPATFPSRIQRNGGGGGVTENVPIFALIKTSSSSLNWKTIKLFNKL